MADTGDGLFLIDTYWKEWEGTAPDWEVLAQQKGVIGAIIKANEGLGHEPNNDFFCREWNRIRDASVRYGHGWFRGAYHFFRFDADPVRQADVFLRVVDRAGGWDDGCLLPICDVESESPPPRDQVVDAISDFVARIRSVTGRPALAYWRGIARDLAIDTRLGAAGLWNASYTDRMVDATEQGFPRPYTWLWQYTDGEVNETTFPTEFPAFGTGLDVSVFLGQHQAEMYTLAAFQRLLVRGELVPEPYRGAV